MTPDIGDIVTNGYDTGEVFKVTAEWVLIESEERSGERWIRLEHFEDGTWWESQSW